MSLLGGSDQGEQQLEAQRRERRHSENLAGGGQDGVADPDYVGRVTKSEVNAGTVDTLENMLSQDWVLANLEDAGVHETRWLMRVMQLQLEAFHPPEDSVWTGELRRYAADDKRQTLEPLDSAQRLVNFETIQTAIARATRSRGGWQQETLRKVIRQSLTGDLSEADDDGGWLG